MEERILVVCVDDERPVLAALRRLLRQEPYDLLTTERAEEALEWVERHPVRVLVTDERMPGMRGFELLRRVREVSPETTRVLLSAHSDDVPEEGLVHRVLAKPWRNEELRAALSALCRASELRSFGTSDLRRVGAIG